MGTITYSIPVAGSTLNSVADPEIATALQTLLTLVNGNIDTNNLSAAAAIRGSQLATNAGITGTQLASNAGITAGQLAAGATSWLSITSTGVSMTAAASQLVKTTGAPVTVTLPAPATDARVGVVATGSVSGASPVTVATGGGVIYGQGCNGVSSVLLGTPNSHLIFQSDGTNWFIIAGQQDTGWVALALSTNIGTAPSTYTPAARLVGDRVFLQGGFVNSTGSAITSGTQFATIPTGLRPASAVTYPIYASSFNASFIAFGSSGAIFYDGLSSWPNTFTTSVDGISYRLS